MDELRRRLQEVDRVPTPDLWPAIMDRAGARDPGRSHRPRAVLLVALGLTLIGGLVLGVVLLGQPDQVRRGVASDPTDASQRGKDDASETSWTGAGFSDLPPSGIAVAEDGELVLFDHAGVGLARTTTPAIAQLQSGPDRMLAAIRPGDPPPVGALPADLGEAPDGCGPAAIGGGVRVAVCGGPAQEPQQIELVDPTGERRVLVGLPEENNGTGHWESAVPSPDGRWVLATWSGECETHAFVVSTATAGRLASVDGADDPSDAVESVGVAWTPEGQAIVHLPSASCRSVADKPGTYLVEPEPLRRHLIIHHQSDPDTSVHEWRLEAYGNTAERIFGQTLDALGLQGCCGEPSHGGAGLTSGARWEGFDIPVGATPAGDPPGVPFNDTVLSSEPIEIDGAPAVAGEADLGPFVAIMCGERVWSFGGSGVGDRPTDDAVRTLATAVLPHLGCTVDGRPQATGHADRS